MRTDTKTVAKIFCQRPVKPNLQIRAPNSNNLIFYSERDGEVDKVVSDDTNVCVFCTFTADGGLSGKGVHSFVVEDGLEVSFDLYWDSAYWAEHCKI